MMINMHCISIPLLYYNYMHAHMCHVWTFSFNYSIVNINRSIVIIPFRRKDLLLASAVQVEREGLTNEAEVHVCTVSLPQSHGLRKM